MLRCGECDSYWATVEHMYVYFTFYTIPNQPMIYEDKDDNMASVRQVFIRNCQTYTYMYNCIPTYPEYMRTKIGVSSKATDSNSCINSCNNPHEDKADGLNTHWQEMESWRRVRRGEKIVTSGFWLTDASLYPPGLAELSAAALSRAQIFEQSRCSWKICPYFVFNWIAIDSV